MSTLLERETAAKVTPPSGSSARPVGRAGSRRLALVVATLMLLLGVTSFWTFAAGPGDAVEALDNLNAWPSVGIPVAPSSLR
jgi:hypothetical protein